MHFASFQPSSQKLLTRKIEVLVFAPLTYFLQRVPASNF